MCTVNIKLSYIIYNYNWYHLVISCVSIKIIVKLCKHQTFKLADHQRPEQFGQTSTSWVATVATGRSGLPWHTVVSQQSDAAQHLYDPLMHPGGLADKNRKKFQTKKSPRLDQTAQVASYRAFMLRRSNQKRSQASEKLASFWLAKIESQGCKMLWMNTPLNLWSLQVLTYFTCDPWIFHGIPWGSCFGSSTTTTSKQPGLSPTWSRRNLCRTTWLLDTLGNYIELLIL